ncbi:unnamed protein product [Fraxinus pennsylvanica]|uniref:Pentatricopeptide repeat-containing protein n=1 Tax=Fraxinus pennsylvanica TaxID=56036 RepID=A0AAD1ZSL6_9LAMI|nr:unnamed protein product [Fraxinus pennsylvanica]
MLIQPPMLQHSSSAAAPDSGNKSTPTSSRTGFIAETCISNRMLLEALVFLEKMSIENNLTPNSVSWSALIGGFSLNGYDKEAIAMLYKMKVAGFEPNARTLASILPACARLKRLRLGREIYGYIARHGFMSSPFIVNGLVDLYRRCGDMESAFQIFSKFSVRDAVSFNTMIAGYCDNGDVLKAKELFDQMEPEGKMRDLISWNSMISGYVDNFMFDEALSMFTDLITTGGIEPDSFTLGSALGACAKMGSLRLGKGMHSYCIVKGLQSNLFIGGGLVEMYCRCQDPETAQKALQEVPERNIAIWNSLISGYARCNQTENIQCILQKMEDDGFKPDDQLKLDKNSSI